jgi:hypothetical protein
MPKLSIARAAIYAAALIIILLLLSAWTGFPFGTVRSWLANAKANQVVAEQGQKSTITADEELDKLVKSVKKNDQAKETGKAAIREALKPRPTDDQNGVDQANRAYDAWRDTIVRMCPDCEGEVVDDHPAPRAEGLRSGKTASEITRANAGWDDYSWGDNVFRRTASRVQRLPGEGSGQYFDHRST